MRSEGRGGGRGKVATGCYTLLNTVNMTLFAIRGASAYLALTKRCVGAPFVRFVFMDCAMMSADERQIQEALFQRAQARGLVITYRYVKSGGTRRITNKIQRCAKNRHGFFACTKSGHWFNVGSVTDVLLLHNVSRGDPHV